MAGELPLTWAELEAALLAEQRTTEALRARLRQREVEYMRLRRWVELASCRTCRVHREATKLEPVNSVPAELEPGSRDQPARPIQLELD